MTTRISLTYFDSAVNDLAAVIEDARKNLADVDFDTIVGTGFSGAIVVPALALSMGKNFVLIRKEGDDSHHGGGRLVGNLGDRWIFVDDFVASGRTRRRVIEKIDDAREQRPAMVGQYLYENYGESDTPGAFRSFSDSWRARP